MKAFKRLNLNAKIIAISVVPVISVVLVLWFVSSQSLENGIYKEKKAKTSELTEVGLSILKHYHQKEKAGEITREQAQAQAKEAVRALRYGPRMKGYFWIQDFTPRVIMHPFVPDLEGEDVSHITDPDGLHLFEALAEKASMDGTGHVPYKWQYYDQEDRIEPKLSYVAEFAPWDWIIGTGVYVNSIKEDVGAMTRQLMYIAAAVLGLSVFVAFFFSRRISRVLTRIVEGLGQSSEQVSSASGQVASSSQSQAEGSSDLHGTDEFGHQ